MNERREAQVAKLIGRNWRDKHQSGYGLHVITSGVVEYVSAADGVSEGVVNLNYWTSTRLVTEA